MAGDVNLTIWDDAARSNLPLIVVDATDVYDRIFNETLEQSYINSRTVATTVATIRTAWAFVGRSNMILPKPHRVYVQEPERAIDHVDTVFAKFRMMAANRSCKICYNGWIVWAGRPDVIGEWAHKLGL